MSELGGFGPEAGLRFVVHGETEIMNSDGTTIGRLRPGNTYVGIEIRDGYVVISSPNQGFGFVEVAAVKLMGGEPAPAVAQSDSERAGVTVQPPVQAAPAAGAVAAAAPSRPQTRPAWKSPVVWLVGLVVVAVAVAATLLFTNRASNDVATGEDPVAPDGLTATVVADATAAPEPASAPTAAPSVEATAAPDPTAEPVPEPTDGPDGPARRDTEGGATAGQPAGQVFGMQVLAAKSLTAGPFGDGANTLSADTAGPVDPPSELWRVDDPLTADPVVIPGAVIASFQDQSIRSLDPHTGAERWRTEFETFRSNELWVADDVVVASSGTDYVLLDLNSGARVGQIASPDGVEGFSANAALVDGTFVGTWNASGSGSITATLVAIETASGEILWQVESVADNFPAPMTTAAGQVIFSHGDAVSGIDLSDGSTNWTYQVDRHLPLAVATDGERILIRDSALRALDAATGELLWSGSQITATYFPISDGVSLVAATDLQVVDVATGASRAAGRVRDDLFGAGAAAAANGIGYATLSDGHLVAVDLATATQLWTVEAVAGDDFASLNPILVGEGNLFLVDRGGDRLIALG